MMPATTKRRKTITATDGIDTNNALRFIDLPPALFAQVSSYLAAPMQALFVASLDPSKTNLPSNESQITASIVLNSHQTNSWSTLDFGEIEQDLAAKLSDDDLRSVLICIDAVHQLIRLKITNCVNISGAGLEPLRASDVLEQMDLSLTGDHQDSVLKSKPKLSCDQVLPVLHAIVERAERNDATSLKHLQFPKRWHRTRPLAFRSFLQRYNQMLQNLSVANLVRCVKCSESFPRNCVWFYEYNAVQKYTCYQCLNHYCENCIVEDGFEMLHICDQCNKQYCRDCSKSSYCDVCALNYCTNCVDVDECDGYQCQEQVCENCQIEDRKLRKCEECSGVFCGQNGCDGTGVRSCESCTRAVCNYCYEQCIDCEYSFCFAEECTSSFKQICKLCDCKSCFECVDSEGDKKIQTCESCGTSYCYYCQVGKDKEELLEKNDCIECLRLIAKTLHSRVHDRTLADWS